jgi:hypothetical protein
LHLSRHASGNILVQMRQDAEKKKNQRVEERDHRLPEDEDEGPGGLEPEYVLICNYIFMRIHMYINICIYIYTYTYI